MYAIFIFLVMIFEGRRSQSSGIRRLHQFVIFIKRKLRYDVLILQKHRKILVEDFTPAGCLRPASSRTRQWSGWHLADVIFHVLLLIVLINVKMHGEEIPGAIGCFYQCYNAWWVAKLVRHFSVKSQFCHADTFNWMWKNCHFSFFKVVYLG